MSIVSEHVDAFLSTVRGAERVLISTHLNPDGDALGSALAMSHFLDGIGIKNEVICNNLAPYNLLFLPGVERIRLEPEHGPYKTGVMLDLDSLDRLGRTKEFFEGISPLILIDHHIPHQMPGDIRIVDTSSPATALILFELLRAAKADFTPEIATCLLTGIVTDTGSFRYRNTTRASMEAAGALLEMGGNIVQICEEVYQRKPLESVRLLQRALDRMQISADGKLAWSTLRLQDFEESGASEVHTEGIVNELLFIDSVHAATLIREPGGGKVRASIRSREGIDISVVAQQFGGGGHKNAAGCTFETSLVDAESSLIGALKECLGS